MLPDAELFVMAEVVLEEVLGRIRVDDRDIVVPAGFELPGIGAEAPLGQIVPRYAYDAAWAADLLTGRTVAELGPERHDGDLLGADWRASIGGLAEAARTAARQVSDGDLVVDSRFGACRPRPTCNA